MTSAARATLIGCTAVLMWSLLALLTVAAGSIPVFQLTATTFAIGGLAGLAWAASRGRLGLTAPSWRVAALGTAGLFGYHALYYTALRSAPPAEANLINYSWPLLIVVFSAFLPGERLKARHVVGALLGLIGTGLIIGGRSEGFSGSGSPLGYGAAAASAVAWASYSLLSRRVKNAPTENVAGCCLITAVLSLVVHLLTEETMWPEDVAQASVIAALGLFPVGLAFYVWDYGVKRGNIQILGAASYLAPLLSTLSLVAAGYAEPSFILGFAGLAIAGGAAVASISFEKKE